MNRSALRVAQALCRVVAASAVGEFTSGRCSSSVRNASYLPAVWCVRRGLLHRHFLSSIPPHLLQRGGEERRNRRASVFCSELQFRQIP